LVFSSTVYPDGREVVHVRVDLTLTANGPAATENARVSGIIDPNTGTVTLTGTAVNISVPSEGPLVQDAGVVRNPSTGDLLFSAGHLMLLEDDTVRVGFYFTD
jgi:hypothetical protein